MADTDTASQIATLEVQLTALKKARGSGVLTVRHGDTSVTYQSMEALLAAISSIVSEIKALGGGSGGRKPRYIIQRTKGL